MEPHIPKLSEYLLTSVLAPLVLTMFVDMAVANPKPFVGYAAALKASGEKQPVHLIHVVQIMGSIATINEARQSFTSITFMS